MATFAQLDASVKSNAAAINITNLMIIKKDVAKGLGSQLKPGRGDCPSGAYNLRDEGCVRAEEAVLRCGLNGVNVSKGVLSCGGPVRGNPKAYTTAKVSEHVLTSTLRFEHGMAITQLVGKLTKRIADAQINADVARSLLSDKFNILHTQASSSNKSPAEKATEVASIDNEFKIAQQALAAKISEAQLKLQRDITSSFEKLLANTLKRLDQIAKAEKKLFRVQLQSGVRVVGLKKVPAKKRA